MSALLLFGRRQDLAFEKEVGTNAQQRNHVRFWRTELQSADGQPVWIGAATFDRGVGLSHTTGQITHHIAPDIDAERDALMHDLAVAGQLTAAYDVTGIGPTLDGRNGGGDRYFTDGELTVGVLAGDDAVGAGAVRTLRARHSDQESVLVVAPAIPSMINMDDPEHRRRRALVNKGLTPRRVLDHEPKVRAICHELVDRVAPLGACDFVHDLAAPLPMIVIGDLLGVPPEDRDALLRWSDDLIGSIKGDAESVKAAAKVPSASTSPTRGA